MTFPAGANLYTQGYGSRPEGVEIPVYQSRAPTANDVNYPIGKQWIWVNNSSYDLIGQTSIGGVLQSTWSSAEGSLATTTMAGVVFLATTAQTASGGAPSASYVSSANDVAAALAAIVVGAGVPATTGTQGYVFLATNAQAAAGALTTKLCN